MNPPAPKPNLLGRELLSNNVNISTVEQRDFATVSVTSAAQTA